MSTSARQRKPLSAGQKGYDKIAAQSRNELYQDGPDNLTRWERVMTLAGKHGVTSYKVMATAFFLEMIGCWLVGVAVVLTAWDATDSSQLQNGFFVGIAYGLAYFVGTRWVNDYVLRRHLSGAITLGYFAVNEIGLGGLLFYTLAQYLGALLAGSTVLGLLTGIITNTTGCTGRNVVPIPLTTNVSLTSVLCLEFFGAAIIVFTLLYNEFCNTEDRKRQKNYRNATFYTAITTGVLVLICFQFNVWTFNNVPYFAGLTSGISAGNNTGLDCRDIVNLAQLYPTKYTNSVFTASGGAWALYLFGPWLGGIIGYAIFMILFSMRVIAPTVNAKGLLRRIVDLPGRVLDEASDDVDSFTNAEVRNNQTSNTKLGQLINPLLTK